MRIPQSGVLIFIFSERFDKGTRTNEVHLAVLMKYEGAFMRNDKLSVQSMDFAVAEMLPLSATSQKYSSCKSSIITTPFFIFINI